MSRYRLFLYTDREVRRGRVRYRLFLYTVREVRRGFVQLEAVPVHR